MVMIGSMNHLDNQMTGDQFAEGLKALRLHQVDFANRAGVGAVTVNRWIHGRLPVPAWAAAHLRLLLAVDQFHREHVAPPPKSRKAAPTSADTDQEEPQA